MVESTRLNQSLGDEQANLLRREIDSLCRAAVEPNRGVEVRATPESIVVADPDPAEALKLSWGPPNWCYTPADWERMVEESGVFTSGAIYPEAGSDANDVSRFAAETARDLGVGRSLIVLRVPDPTRPQLVRT